ncbi:Spc98 family-domain-containing protein [Zopfochytrium polystomum]|nr:Spc98 family-domain-containing protein [Zopfochytrium polystomum]
MPATASGSSSFSKSRSANNLAAELDKGIMLDERAKALLVSSALPGSPSVTIDGTTLFGTPSRVRSASVSKALRRAAKSFDEKWKSTLAPTFTRYKIAPVPRSAVPPIGHHSLPEQEVLILEDLLFVMLGVEGVYIERKKVPPRAPSVYRIDPSLDPSLSELIQRILPICTAYNTLNAFIDLRSAFECGRVSHALSATLRAFVKDYRVLVAQLEYQVHFAPGFGLQKLWAHVLPSIHLLDILSRLVGEIVQKEDARQGDAEILASSFAMEAPGSKYGGATLGIIANATVTMSGDPIAKKILASILEKASVPYYKMLRKWIHHGLIDDPFDEFMVYERKGMSKEQIAQDYNDVYWDQRYTLRKDRIPKFVASFSEKVLLAGKYLNVVRECGEKFADEVKSLVKAHTAMDAANDLDSQSKEVKFANEVDLAYKFANETLLNVLFKSENMQDRMRSFKHYFLLDQADFLTHFLDLASAELMKPAEAVSVSSLSSILELVLRNPGSASALDPYKEFISVELSPYSLVEQLLRVNAVAGVDYDAFLKGARLPEELIKDKQLQEEAVGGLVGIVDKLTGFDTVMLSCSVPFPASLILNKRTHTKHQLLFRHLLHCKNIERLLALAWMGRTKEKFVHPSHRTRLRAGTRSGASFAATTAARTDAKSNHSASSEERLFENRMAMLRSRHLHFIQQFLYFLTFEIIDPHWQVFEDKLAKAATVEDVLEFHNDFLDSCLKDCMLTNPKLLKTFGKITRMSLNFVAFADAYAKARRASPLASYNPAADSFSSPYSSTKHYDSFEALNDCQDFGRLGAGSEADGALKQLTEGQLSSVRAFINALQLLGAVDSTPRLQELVTRLDYNGFYSKSAVAGVSAEGLRALQALVEGDGRVGVNRR